MHFNKLAFASLATFAVVRADLELDDDDIPRQCRDVCEPVRTLGRICDDINDDRVDDRTEDLLERQCFCANDSFNVRQVAAQCASCMHEFQNDRDDLEDIDDIMFTCGFASTSYNSADVATVTGVVVEATPYSVSSELTTTIQPGSGNGNGNTNTGSQPTPTGNSDDNDNNNDNNNNNGGSNNQDNNNNDNNSNDPENTDNAAPGLTPPGFGFGVVGVAAYAGLAAVAGAMLLQ